jgi:hypothetical protein
MAEPPSIFGGPSLSDPETAAAVGLLRMTGDQAAAELATLTDDPNMMLLVRGLAGLAHRWGSVLCGSGGDLDAALAAWQTTGALPPPL